MAKKQVASRMQALVEAFDDLTPRRRVEIDEYVATEDCIDHADHAVASGIEQIEMREAAHRAHLWLHGAPFWRVEKVLTVLFRHAAKARRSIGAASRLR